MNFQSQNPGGESRSDVPDPMTHPTTSRLSTEGVEGSSSEEISPCNFQYTFGWSRAAARVRPPTTPNRRVWTPSSLTSSSVLHSQPPRPGVTDPTSGSAVRRSGRGRASAFLVPSRLKPEVSPPALVTRGQGILPELHVLGAGAGTLRNFPLLWWLGAATGATAEASHAEQP